MIAVTSGPGPLRVAMLASGGGGNFRAALGLARRRPDLVELCLLVTDNPGRPVETAARYAGVPTLVGHFDETCGRASDCRPPAERAAYAERARGYHDTVDARIAAFEADHGAIDLLVFAYRRWVHGNLLDRFRHRIVNQHPGDLTVLDGAGQRVLVGNDPVHAALAAGMPATRTSTFFVDDGPDTGPILCQGPPVPVTGHAGRAAADRHEAVQKELSDWPSLVCALTTLATRVVEIDPDRPHADGSATVVVDGVALPFGGIRLGDEPVPVGAATRREEEG